MKPGSEKNWWDFGVCGDRRRFGQERRGAEVEEENATAELEPRALRDERVHDRGEPERGDAAVERIGCRCAEATDKSREAAVRQRAAKAKQPDRADGRGDRETDDKTFEQRRYGRRKGSFWVTKNPPSNEGGFDREGRPRAVALPGG